ncbi:MAG TPA: ABC transporter permease [Acidimicrobiia bacterium]
MAAVRVLALSELRRRWRSVVVLTLLVGFSGAVVLALVGGARRTETSLARFENASRSADVEFDAGDVTAAQIDELRRVPGVAAVAQLQQLTLISRTGPFSNQFLPVAAQIDTRFGTDVDRARVVEGRAARLDAVDELSISEGLASLLHVGVGDRLSFDSFNNADIEQGDAAIAPHGPRVTFHIVGIVRRPLDLGGRGVTGILVPTTAFLERYRDEIGSFSGAVLRVRTERGSADVDRVTRAARRIFRSPSFGVTSLTIEGQGAQNAIDVTTVGLYVAAAIAALTAVVGIAIAMSREIAFNDVNQLTLSALGLGPRHRALAAAAIGLPVALVGALIAAVGAVLASPIFPIGVAAKAEPDSGLRLDPAAVGVGFLAVIVTVLVVAAIAGLRTARATRRRAEPARPSVSARVTAEWGAPPSVAVGVRFALDRGRQRHALPVRSSLLGAGFGVLVVAAVLVFTSGLHHLVTTPAQYGWTWDLIGYDESANPASGRDCGPIETRLTADRTFAAVAAVCTAGIDVDGRSVTAWGYRQLRGTVQPEIVEGRAPRGMHEIALGADTLAALDRHLGDTVRVTAGRPAKKFRIVGQAVTLGVSDPAPIADGAVFTATALDALRADGGGWNFVVKLAPGVSRAAAIRGERKAAVLGGPVLPTLPAEIDRVDQIRGLPVALAVFVAVVALVAVGLALVSSLRRRRRELAVLKTLGFSRRQVRSTVAWQATTVAVVGLLVGIPLGLVVGGYVWHRVADELGVSTGRAWPWLAIALLAVGALLAVNLIAAFPARRAARTRPAVVLRSE